LFLEVPLQFLALWATKRAFLSGKSLKTEVFRDSLYKKAVFGVFPNKKKIKLAGFLFTIVVSALRSRSVGIAASAAKKDVR
jgi:hypothetical protein